MKKAIIGTKLGMSQIFNADGTVVPVTVVEAGPCDIVQVKTKAKEGYDAVQVSLSPVKEARVTKPLLGHFKKAGVQTARFLREFRFEDCSKYAVGGKILCDSFTVGDKVDVIGRSKGRGFTGVIKRWNNQRVGSMSHGTGPIHRSVGSMGAHTDPARVFKNKHMAGQYGNEQVTVKNLEVVRVDKERNLLLIKGGIPGANGTLVIVRG